MSNASWGYQRCGAGVFNGVDVRFTVVASVSADFLGVAAGVLVNRTHEVRQVAGVTSLVRESGSNDDLVGTVNGYLRVVTLNDGLAAQHDLGRSEERRVGNC